MNGIVRNLRRNEESHPSMFGPDKRQQVISFRLELSEATGDILAYLPIEMRGGSITGEVIEGDRVEIIGKKSQAGVLITQKFRNLTTDSTVAVNEPRSHIFLRIGFAILILGFSCLSRLY